MSLRIYLALFVAALLLPLGIAQFQPTPGYLDADYYYAGGLQLFSGKGFNEPYIWNYLDGVKTLPHPSHSYWMPLASVVSVLGMWLTGSADFASARIFFILAAGLVSPLVAYFSYLFTQNKGLSIASGLLAIFSVYNAPFVGVTDNFSLFMLFGGLYFITAFHLLSSPARALNWFFLGLFAGLMSLARSDGLLWLGMTGLLAARLSPPGPILQRARFIMFSSFIALSGFLLIMSPWYARNLSAYGALMTPGGSRVLWLANYDQTFIYPPDLLTKESFMALGWERIMQDRLFALGANLLNAFAAHGGIVLFPFILAGAYVNRRNKLVQLALTAWLILTAIMSFVFPFAGSRGAYFHAGAALQPMWWLLAPLGLEALMDSLQRRNWGNEQARIVFRGGLVLISAILTGFVVYLRVFSLGWSEKEGDYRPAEKYLLENGMGPEDIVIVLNAPSYYLQTGRPAVSIPYGGETAILAVSDQFNAEYLILESAGAIDLNNDLYNGKSHDKRFVYLGEVNDASIYRIDPAP